MIAVIIIAFIAQFFMKLAGRSDNNSNDNDLERNELPRGSGGGGGLGGSDGFTTNPFHQQPTGHNHNRASGGIQSPLTQLTESQRKRQLFPNLGIKGLLTGSRRTGGAKNNTSYEMVSIEDSTHNPAHSQFQILGEGDEDEEEEGVDQFKDDDEDSAHKTTSNSNKNNNKPYDPDLREKLMIRHEREEQEQQEKQQKQEELDRSNSERDREEALHYLNTAEEVQGEHSEEDEQHNNNNNEEQGVGRKKGKKGKKKNRRHRGTEESHMSDL
jgi:hypothetical protein